MYPPHHYGGYELVWEAAVEHLRRIGHDVRVLTTDTRTSARDDDPPYVHRELRWTLEDARFRVLGRRERVSLARHNHRTLGRHLDDFEPHVVTWWSMGGLTLTMLETVRRRGLPAVALVHDEWLDYGRRADGWSSPFRNRWRRAAPLAERLTGIPAVVDYGGAARYLFVSDHLRRHAEGLGLGLRDTGVAHSGIDGAFLQEPQPPHAWRWRLLYVGRLDPRKGVQTAVDALAHLPGEAQLDIAGGWDSQEEARLRERAREVGVEDRVTFLGQSNRDDLIRAYDESDVVVFPVVWQEPWGLVPIEAMARGRPVVATGRGGSAEYLRDGDNCLLFAAEEAGRLAAAVRRLADDPALRDHLRATGLETARRHTQTTLNAAVEHAIAER